jgi:hypothetical protein
MRNVIFSVLLFFSCSFTAITIPEFNAGMHSVNDIPLPAGFERTAVQPGSFAAYLRNLPLRKDKTVYLYNGQAKPNQSLHYAVIDMSTGDKDLQQCADAVMRLRAEYFFGKKMYDSILFKSSDHSVYKFSTHLKNNPMGLRQSFLKYMETVFINCGTYTLEQSLQPVADFAAMQPGDVFVKGGAPGHAEIIVDMAINKITGKKIYLLAEGYMPAQDIHIVLNPLNPARGPWYEDMAGGKQVVTASWVFEKKQLRRW